MASTLAGRIPGGTFQLLGCSGAPGSGKSTLAELVVHLLSLGGQHALRLSLDDYYLSRDERRKLARQQHALFAQRGVPGTHDWQRLIDDLDRLRSGDIGNLRLPIFDKSLDDQADQSRFRRLDIPPRIVILEGWFIGSAPQESWALNDPLNVFEAEQDADGRWRRLVNESLAQCHRDLAPRLDGCWFLAVPDWDSVIDWRWQQERETNMDGRRLHLQSRQAVRCFLDPFQRIALHMLSECEQWADPVIGIDHQHLMSFR